jgi:alpha-tubulin suppressor-like RCC1 family protein
MFTPSLSCAPFRSIVVLTGVVVFSLLVVRVRAAEPGGWPVVEIDESGEWSAVPTRVLAWGNNGQGQTAVPVDAENVVGLAVDYGHTVALRANGTVIAWGDNMYGQTNVPNDLADVVKVAPGRTYSFGLRRDGSVMKWPLGPYGESSVPEGLGDVVALGAGGWNAVAVRRDGTVVAWGDSTFGQTN